MRQIAILVSKHPRLLLGLGLLSSTPWLTGFVLLSSKVATLPVTPEAPEISFVWDGEAPSISDKAKFKDGAYQDLDDVAFMQQLLAEAMGIWNAVPGSFVKLTAAEGDAKLDDEDKQFSIVTAKSANLTSAAFARPKVPEDDSGIIDDCDISIADHKVSAAGLAFTIAHELGHCLGLGHAHTNYNAMMGYSRMDQQLKLGADDMAGVIYLYPDPNSVPEKPKELVCGTVARGPGASNGWGGSALAALLLLLPLGMTLTSGVRCRNSGDRSGGPSVPPRLAHAQSRVRGSGDRRAS